MSKFCQTSHAIAQVLISDHTKTQLFSCECLCPSLLFNIKRTIKVSNSCRLCVWSSENSLHDCGNFTMIPPARNLSGNTHGECCSFAISLSHVPVLLQNGHRSSCSDIALTPSIRKRQILSQSLPTFLWQKTTCRCPQCFHLKHLL